jgi:hypothetical protein
MSCFFKNNNKKRKAKAKQMKQMALLSLFFLTSSLRVGEKVTYELEF